MINEETDARGVYEYLASHALISDEVKDEVEKQCKFTGHKESAKCIEAQDKAYSDLPLNIFAIYAPICLNANLTTKPKDPSVSHNFEPHYLLILFEAYKLKLVYTICYTMQPIHVVTITQLST